MAIKTFTTGEVLTAADTNTYLANAGLVCIASKTFTTTSSAQQIDSCFTSTYNNYLITFAGIGSGTSSEFLRARFVDGTTPISTAIYHHSYAYSGSTAMTVAYQGAQSNNIIGFVGDTAGSMVWNIYNPQVATTTTGNSSYMTSATNDFVNGNNGQMVLASTQFEGIYMYPNAGTWSGTITVYGYRKA